MTIDPVRPPFTHFPASPPRFDVDRAFRQSIRMLFRAPVTHLGITLLILTCTATIGMIVHTLISPITPQPGDNELDRIGAVTEILCVAGLIVVATGVWPLSTTLPVLLSRRLGSGPSLGTAATALPASLVAHLALLLPFAVVIVPLWILADSGNSLIALLGYMVSRLVILVAVALSIRFALVGPIIALERCGPVRAVRRSWQLTADNHLSLAAVLMLGGVVAAAILVPMGLVCVLPTSLVAGDLLWSASDSDLTLAPALLTGAVVVASTVSVAMMSSTIWAGYLECRTAEIGRSGLPPQ
ncbi:MAG: hypothetical protein WAV90_03140 [Gordonia amarae]